MTRVQFAISSLVFYSLRVRGPSEWVFVEISDAEGNTGTSELTGTGGSRDIPSALAEMASRLRGTPINDETEIEGLLDISAELLRRDRIKATAISGIRTAVAEGLAKKEGTSLARYLGGSPSDTIPLYANINRAMLPDNEGREDRSPALFAKIATLAVDRGFTTVKCAPFDECHTPYNSQGLPEQTKLGLERMAAVREAIGVNIRLLVDCHSRFDMDTSLALESELHSLGVSWYEEPMNPLTEPENLGKLRECARMPIAGGEHGYGFDVFYSLIKNGSLDVAMPDIKYCGGVGEAASIGWALEAQNPGSVSLHSPSGPASLLASAHATSVFKGVWPLEHAIEEVAWRAKILDPPERIENGSLVIPPAPGIGAILNTSFIKKHGYSWTP